MCVDSIPVPENGYSSGGYVSSKQDFPPLPTQNSQDAKINELSTAVKYIQNCLEEILNRNPEFNPGANNSSGNISNRHVDSSLTNSHFVSKSTFPVPVAQNSSQEAKNGSQSVFRQ